MNLMSSFNDGKKGKETENRKPLVVLYDMPGIQAAQQSTCIANLILSNDGPIQYSEVFILNEDIYIVIYIGRSSLKKKGLSPAVFIRLER